jgi:hypothetical protein
MGQRDLSFGLSLCTVVPPLPYKAMILSIALHKPSRICPMGESLHVMTQQLKALIMMIFPRSQLPFPVSGCLIPGVKHPDTCFTVLLCCASCARHSDSLTFGPMSTKSLAVFGHEGAGKKSIVGSLIYQVPNPSMSKSLPGMALISVAFFYISLSSGLPWLPWQT